VNNSKIIAESIDVSPYTIVSTFTFRELKKGELGKLPPYI
jgi:hypothetical protein